MHLKLRAGEEQNHCLS